MLRTEKLAMGVLSGLRDQPQSNGMRYSYKRLQGRKVGPNSTQPTSLKSINLHETFSLYTRTSLKLLRLSLVCRCETTNRNQLFI